MPRRCTKQAGFVVDKWKRCQKNKAMPKGAAADCAFFCCVITITPHLIPRAGRAFKIVGPHRLLRVAVEPGVKPVRTVFTACFPALRDVLRSRSIRGLLCPQGAASENPGEP